MYALVKIEKNEAAKNGVVIYRGGIKVTAYTNPDFEYKRHVLFIISREHGDTIKCNDLNYFPVTDNIYALADMWDDIRELYEFLIKQEKEISPLLNLLVRDQLKRAFEYPQTFTYKKSSRVSEAINSIWNNIFYVVKQNNKTFVDYVPVNTVDEFIDELIHTYEFELLDKFFANESIVKCSGEKAAEYYALNDTKNNAISFIRNMIKEKGNGITLKDGDMNIHVNISTF